MIILFIYRRIWVAGIIGACAGILGLSGLNGFIFYFIFSFVVLSFLILLRVKFDVKETLINYSPLWKEGLTQGVSVSIYILFIFYYFYKLVNKILFFRLLF